VEDPQTDATTPRQDASTFTTHLSQRTSEDDG